MWTCPRCGNTFVTANMSHSCLRPGVDISLEQHFSGKPPHLRSLYEAWRTCVEQFGPFVVVPQKTRICFQTRIRFARAVIRKGWVECSFLLTRPVPKPATFTRIEFVPPQYHIPYFKLTRPGQLDDPDLRALVRESYAIGKQSE